ECVLVQILRIGNQIFDKIAAADIMHQVAEELAAKRIVAHVLENAAAVSVGMGVLEIVRRGIGESLEQERFDAAVPRAIDNGFVCENGIAARGCVQDQQERGVSEKCPKHEELSSNSK